MTEHNTKTIIKKLKKDKINVNEVIQLLKNNEIANDNLDLLDIIIRKSIKELDISNELVNDLMEIYKNNLPKKQNVYKERYILRNICNIINKLSIEEKTNQQIEILKLVNERENIENKFILYATLAQEIDTIEAIEKLIEQINLNDRLHKNKYLIKTIIDQINKYIDKNESYDENKVKDLQTKLIKIIHENKFNNFELLNKVLENNKTDNIDIITDLCIKFHNKTKKEKKFFSIIKGFSILPFAFGIITCLPSVIVGAGWANIALMLPFTASIGYISITNKELKNTIYSMINYFNEQKNSNNKDGIANLQSQIIDMTITLDDNTKVIDELLNSIDFNTKNISEDFEKIEKHYSNNLKKLYTKGIEAIKQGKGEETEKYFLKKLQEYNDPKQKKSSKFKKETKALIISLGTNNNYENCSIELKNEFNKAIQNIIKNKKLLSFGLDKETYNLAKDLINPINSQEETINYSISETDEEKKPLIDKSKENKNILTETRQNSSDNINNNKALLSNLNEAGDNISAIQNTHDLPSPTGL